MANGSAGRYFDLVRQQLYSATKATPQAFLILQSPATTCLEV
jgi:hypothetical protein